MLADMHINRQQLLKIPLHFFVDFAQSGGELCHADRFQQIRNDTVFDRALCVFEIIITGQKYDRNERLQLPDTLCQFCSGDKGHLNIGQQQIRLQLFNQLQSIQAVSGTSDQAKADLLPANHAADRFPQFLLIVGNYNSIILLGHADPLFSGPDSGSDYTDDVQICKEIIRQQNTLLQTCAFFGTVFRRVC